MPEQQWAIGQRIYDDDYGQSGEITDVDVKYHSGVPVITVRFDNGDLGQFTPDEGTRKVDG